MDFSRRLLALGCALGIAGCAQTSLGGSPGSLGPGASVLPATGHGAWSPLRKRHDSSAGPEIYDFQGYPDAYTPLTGLANIGKTLYGTTQSGGSANLGAVYSVTTSGVEHVMHSFLGGTDGQNPDAPLTVVNGTLYGTAYQSGQEHGTIFTITPSGTYNIIYNFGTKSGDCDEPDSAMIYVPTKNALYGTAYGGGADGEGCIFKLSLGGKTPKESIVYSFTGASNSSTEASAPILFKNALWVTTPGGGTSGYGAVLKITFAGKESLVYSFKNEPDGAGPYAALTAIGNTLYGTTIDGGQGACGGYAGCGIVFKLTAGGKETVLHRFVDNPSQLDGDNPQSPLLDVDGTLYGVTENCSGNGCDAGVVYSIKPSGGERIVYDFAPPTSDPSGYPESPFGSLLILNGLLYGTSANSIHTDYGSVYAVSP